MRSVYSFLLLTTLLTSTAYATHFKGGDISVSRTSAAALTYQITVRLFLEDRGMSAESFTQKVCFGDGQTATWPLSSSVRVEGSNISEMKFQGTYTYSSTGQFQISAPIDNRTLDLLNYPNTGDSPAFLWTVINTQLPNNTPVLPAPTFTAGIKQIYSSDLKPSVSDSDSISIRVARLSKGSPGTCGVRMIDHDYSYPNEVSQSGVFKIDNVEKKLIWNAPERVGLYTYAFVVDEWRDGIKISETYREGVIEVIDKPGATVEVPPFEHAESNGVLTSIPKVSSPEVTMAIEAYPVPTQDFVTVKAYSKNRAVIRLQLIDMKGRVLSEITSRAEVLAVQEEFDMRNLAAGIYLIKADNSVDAISQKVVR